MTGLAEQTMKAYSELLAETYRDALRQAYDNRHSITWVELDPIARVVLAEMYQTDREQSWRESMAGAGTPFRTGNDPARNRADDGSAPPLLMIFGIDVRKGAAGTGIRWDVGTPSNFATFAECTSTGLDCNCPEPGTSGCRHTPECAAHTITPKGDPK